MAAMVEIGNPWPGTRPYMKLYDAREKARTGYGWFDPHGVFWLYRKSGPRKPQEPAELKDAQFRIWRKYPTTKQGAPAPGPAVTQFERVK